MDQVQLAQPVRVLVVDDDPAFAEMTATFLERHDEPIEIETATSAEQGLALLNGEDRFDCVVSDYDMPVTDGLEFLEAIRAARPDVPFVLFTGEGSEEIASRAISAGVTDYLQKTGGTEQYERLANRIVHATSARRAEREAEETRAHLQTIVESATDVILTIDGSSTIQFANGAVEPVFGYAPEAIEGEPLTILMTERFRDRYLEAIRQYAAEGKRQFDWTEVEFSGVHRDGHELPLSVSFGEFTRNGERYFTGIIRDVTERKRREKRLAGLNGMLAEFMEVSDRQKLCNIAIEAAADRLDLPATTIALFDSESGTLVPAARTPVAQRRIDESRLLQRDSLAWEAFTSGDVAVIDDSAAELVDGDFPESLSAYSVGKHGVFVTAVEAPRDLSNDETAFVETVVGNLRDALDRVEREELLRKREERLEEQNEWLERLNRVNDVIRRIDQVLVGATARTEIERAVCEELTDDGPYRFAWIGVYDARTDRLEPREWAGDDRGYLDAVSLDADGEAVEPDHPAVRAARTQEAIVIEDVLTDPPLAPWRKVAIDRGYRSLMAIPLDYRDRLYGVLTVYTDRQGAFGELERAVLAELGETIAHAINSAESKRALVSDEVVELEFEVEPSEIPSLEPLGRHPECEGELEGIVPGTEDTFRTYFTLRDGKGDVAERLDESATVSECTSIVDREDATVVECTLTAESIVAWLLDHGAVPTSLSIDGRSRVTVELSPDTDVREFVDLFRATYPGAELIARRGRERTVQTRQAFHSEFESRLTPRQLEILRTAYYSGFFRTPRERTGQEIAASLDISQPTFSSHLRTGLRKLLAMLYENDADESRG